MRALLLAAGLGTRLRPLTDTVPKCLVEIDGRPLLDYWVELLCKGGVLDILVNTHHLEAEVMRYVERCPHPVRLSTAREEKLLGTGGTLLGNRAFFGAGPAVLIHADNLSLFDFRAFARTYESRDADIEMTMMTFRTDSPRSCGIVELDRRGVVRALHEKVENPPGNLANAAVYILAPTVIEFLAGLGKQEIDFSTEVLPHFMGRINTFHNDVYHRDIGTLESLAAARIEYPAVAAKQAGAS